MGSFYTRTRIPLIRSFVQQLELRTFKTDSKLQNLVRNKKEQNRRPEPRKHSKDPPLAILVFFTFFRHCETFFEKFWIAPVWQGEN